MNKQPPPLLETVLRRQDVWRGFVPSFAAEDGVETGYPLLNAALVHSGWPPGALVEVCQDAGAASAEWQLLLPALRQARGFVVLLNPPALPFAAALVQAGLDLDRVLVVQTDDKPGFLKSYVELARTSVCDVVLAWQPAQTLSYTDLRKCALAGNDHSLCVLFRPFNALRQSSPAALRLACFWRRTQLEVRIYKQKGALVKERERVLLPVAGLPAELWRPDDFAETSIQSAATAQVVSLFDKT